MQWFRNLHQDPAPKSGYEPIGGEDTEFLEFGNNPKFVTKWDGTNLETLIENSEPFHRGGFYYFGIVFLAILAMVMLALFGIYFYEFLTLPWCAPEGYRSNYQLENDNFLRD